MLNKRKSVTVVILFVLGLSLVLTATVFAVGLQTRLTGAEEAPGPGDPDGSGRVELRINVDKRKVCWKLRVHNIAPATAAHIHVAEAGVAGPVVIGLSAPTNGASSGCSTNVDRDLLAAITHHPEDYYVNVHNADYPAGAVRGQLGW